MAKIKGAKIVTVVKPPVTGTPNTFSFTTPTPVVTSAGVYTPEDSLVRTLWSAEQYPQGTHTERWDGLLDDYTPAPPGNYHVKVLSHNIQYTWEGARIGNSSTALTGSSIHRADRLAFCLAVAGTNLYYGTGYFERNNAQFVTPLNSIGERARVVASNGGTNQNTFHNCTDGNYVYWGGDISSQSGAPTGNFVFATRVSNNSLVNFEGGTPLRFYSAIAYTPEIGTHFITSMAVQKTGNYLFVARENSQLWILDKITGISVSKLTLTGIRHLAVDMNNNLWISRGNTVEKYTVNGAGAITATGITLGGITEPAAIAVSPDNNTVIVADAGINQQVIKGFSNSSGSAIWTLGNPGGYMTDATVTDNKFYFQDNREAYPISIAFQADGSFWVTEPENNRIQHYSASRTFLNRIAYKNGTLFVSAHGTNRLFIGMLEYSIDNTKPLDNGQNGSWALTKNWGGSLEPGYVYNFVNIEQVFTANGRTYAFVQRENNNYDVYELTTNGVLRKTKHSFGTDFKIIDNATLLYNNRGPQVGATAQYVTYPLIGVDNNNDPVWASAASQTITTPVITAGDGMGDYRLSDGKMYYYQPVRVDNGSSGEYHLAGFKTSSSKWLFKTSPGTSRFYYGPFPDKGEFDNGNNVNQAGAYMTLQGTNLLWTYKGEFWKDVQTNYFNHFHTSGLFIGQFGRNKNSNDEESNPPGNEGNMFRGAWVQQTSNQAFVFSGGEGVYGGVHRWKIEGLNTVRLQTCTFNPALNYTPLPAYLMGDFEHLTTNINGRFGWTLSHPNSNSNGNWYVIAGMRTPSKYGLQDINAEYFQQGGNENIRTVSRTLNNSTTLNNWKITGKFYTEGGSNYNGRGGGAVLEIADPAGKAIARFSIEDAEYQGQVSYARANNINLITWETPNKRKDIIVKNPPFQISNNNGTLTFSYAGYTGTTNTIADAGADITRPTTFRLRFTPGDYGKVISVTQLRLFNK